jgi:hypothetical protein
MINLTVEAIDSRTDDELFKLLGKELEKRISANRGSPEFVAEIRNLPIGLRAMAATYELDVSLALDDLGWHFGNWHNMELAEETVQGLEELDARGLAEVFREAFQLAKQYWAELGAEDWMEWYPDSLFERAVRPLDKQARSILKDKGDSIFKYWVNYARRHPERIGAVEDA